MSLGKCKYRRGPSLASRRKKPTMVGNPAKTRITGTGSSRSNSHNPISELYGLDVGPNRPFPDRSTLSVTAARWLFGSSRGHP